MGNLIQLVSGSKAFGARGLFKEATFAINDGEHVGVIGPNGAGKTTLFRILTGEEELDEGEVVRSRSLRMGYLAQEVVWSPNETLEEYLSECRLPIWELKSLGLGLGLDENKFLSPISSLSGGYRMRCKLLYLIGSEPNLMLLDEPTNYLDLETLLVLEKFLQGYEGASLVISHDREFLKRTTDQTLEIENSEITKYPGNIDDYFEQKELIRVQTEKEALSVAAKRKAILDFAARFGAKATKARQVQSRLKTLNKLQEIEIKPLPVSSRIAIPEPERIGKKAIEVKNANLGYGNKTILSEVDLSLIRGDKVAVVGYNGVGKSTLLKGLAHVIDPLQGSIEYGLNVEIGYYAQHVADELDLDSTILDEFQRAADPSITHQQILDLAGSLLFSGDRIEMKIEKLSGGEKARVALGKILLMRVPVLLMDEATNHLDFGTVEALTQALSQYKGTLVLVSHDRGFIRRIATKILEIRDGRILEYHGSYDEYVWSVEKGSLSQLPGLEAETAETSKTGGAKSKSKSPNLKEARKELKTKIRDLEKRSKQIESEITRLQSEIEKLNDELNTASSELKAELLKKLGALPHQIIELESEWEKVLEARDNASQSLNNIEKNKM